MEAGGLGEHHGDTELNADYIAMAQARVEKAQREREHGVEGAALVEAGQGTLLWT